VRRGTHAPQAAGAIHTDFERGFIKADVIRVEDLLAVGSEHAAREKGLLKVEGREYLVQDGDVIHFKFNV
jgi:ribosome-binding ATPase YchF (GTP1/OBG family)